MTFRRDLKLLAAFALYCLHWPALAAQTHGSILSQAEQALARKDAVTAELAASRALKAGTPREQVAAYMGEALLLRGDLDAARRWLGEGRFAPASAQRGFHALGRLQVAQGNFDEAARAFDRALASGPATARLWVDIGTLRYRSGQQHLALDAAQRALAVGPQDPAALRFRAVLTRDAEGLLPSLAWFEQAVQRTPQDLDLLAEYAATLGDAGRNRDMLAVARQMVRIDPRDPRAFYLQAVLAARAGHYGLARRLLWKTGAAYDTRPAGLLLGGLVELEMGNPGLAVDRFEALLRLQPHNGQARQLLARALLADGDGREVVGRFAAVADRAAATPYLLTLIGRAHELMGDRRSAAGYLDRAALPPSVRLSLLSGGGAAGPASWQGTLAPNDPAAAVARLRVMLADGQVAGARKEAARLLQRYPGSADFERLAGDVALLAGDRPAALALYRRAAAVRTDQALALRMFIADDRRGPERRADLAAFLARNPSSLPTLRLYGTDAALAGEWDSAEPALIRALSLAGGNDPSLMARLGQVQAARGQRSAALATLRRAHQLQPSSRQATAALARILQAATIDRPGQRALQQRLRTS